MKPLHHLLMSALKNALIVIAAFALYETNWGNEADVETAIPRKREPARALWSAVAFIEHIRVWFSDWAVNVSIIQLFALINDNK